MTRRPERHHDALVGSAFLPLHKAAFGVATGVTAAGLVFSITAVDLLRNPEPGFPLTLLGQYFAGYSVSWSGALIGAAWAAFSGFVLGWFFAFSRNLLIAIILFAVRRRAELIETSSFLDQL